MRISTGQNLADSRKIYAHPWVALTTAALLTLGCDALPPEPAPEDVPHSAPNGDASGKDAVDVGAPPGSGSRPPISTAPVDAATAASPDADDDVRTSLLQADAVDGDDAAALDAGAQVLDAAAADAGPALDTAAADAADAQTNTADASIVDAGPPIVCPSGVMLAEDGPATLGMHPGQACLACHDSYQGSPKFTAAGTVYSVLNATDLCAGVPGAEVHFTYADGMPSVAFTSSSGNFMQKGNGKLPYTVKIVVDGKERAMKTPQYDGDCNHCHTAKGAFGAPGRILIP